MPPAWTRRAFKSPSARLPERAGGLLKTRLLRADLQTLPRFPAWLASGEHAQAFTPVSAAGGSRPGVHAGSRKPRSRYFRLRVSSVSHVYVARADLVRDANRVNAVDRPAATQTACPVGRPTRRERRAGNRLRRKGP